MQGQEIEGAGEGFLCMKAAWPSTIRTIFGDQDRFETTYFAPFKVGFSSSTSLAKVPTLQRIQGVGWGKEWGGGLVGVKYIQAQQILPNRKALSLRLCHMSKASHTQST